MEVPTYAVSTNPTNQNRQDNNDIFLMTQNNNDNNISHNGNNLQEATLTFDESSDSGMDNRELLPLFQFNSLSSFFSECKNCVLSSWTNWAYASSISFLCGHSAFNTLDPSYHVINSELILLNSDTEDILLLNNKSAPLSVMKLLCEMMVVFITILIVCKILLSVVVEFMVNLIESTLVLVSLLIILKVLIYFVLKDTTISTVSVSTPSEANISIYQSSLSNWREGKTNKEEYQKANCIVKLRKLFTSLLPHLRSPQLQAINGYIEDGNISLNERGYNYEDNSMQNRRNTFLNDNYTEESRIIQEYQHPIRQIEQDEQQSNLSYHRSNCIVCLENEVKIALIPCGHFCFCISCVHRVPENSCPICREAVVFRQIIY